MTASRNQRKSNVERAYFETHAKAADAVDKATGNEGAHGEKLDKGQMVTETIERDADAQRRKTTETTETTETTKVEES